LHTAASSRLFAIISLPAASLPCPEFDSGLFQQLILRLLAGKRLEKEATKSGKGVEKAWKKNGTSIN